MYFIKLFHFKSSQARTDAAHSSTKTMASSPPPLQSNLSFCNLKDAESDRSRFLVHALDPSFGEDVESGEMDRRVTALEGGGGG